MESPLLPSSPPVVPPIHPPVPPNCSATASSDSASRDLAIHGIFQKTKVEQPEMNRNFNCSDSDPEILMKPIPFTEIEWKNKVVIGCTVAVAIELLIVFVMVLYWKQIRWTLRKLACPCDDFYRRHRHGPLQRREETNVYETNVDSDDSLSVDQSLQIYMPSGDETERTNRVEGQSHHSEGHSSNVEYSQIGFPSNYDRYNHYVEEEDDEEEVRGAYFGAKQTRRFGGSPSNRSPAIMAERSYCLPAAAGATSAVEVSAVVHSASRMNVLN